MLRMREPTCSAIADFDEHEQVVFARDVGAGLRAIVAVHSTVCGPAFGGCRIWPYRNDDEALTDALRLSRGMTCKADDLRSALWRRQIGDPGRPEAGQDAGAAASHGPGRRPARGPLRHRRRHRHHPRGSADHARGDPAHRGRDHGRRPAARGHRVRGAPGAPRRGRARARTTDLEGLRVAVQGLGTVGMPLCRYLHEAGAEFVVTDLDAARVADAERAFGAGRSNPMPSTGRPWTCSRPAPWARS